MAWSWLRRRADRPSVPAPTAVRPPATAPVRAEGAWQELPAVQRTLEPLSPVAPLDAFTNGLAAHQNPSFLAPLGHRVDPDGPAGLVTGLASIRPGNPIAYAASTTLAVPAARKPRPAVQRHTITWSTATAAQPAESTAVNLSDATPIEETTGTEPGPAPGTTADIGVGEVVTPPAPAAPLAPVAPTVPTAGPVAPTVPTAAPVAATQSTAAGPAPTTEPTPASIDRPGPGAEPESVTAAGEVVSPEPPQAGTSDAPDAPLLGSAPDAMVPGAETHGAPDPAQARSPERTTPLPVSRSAAVAGAAQPTRQPIANAQLPESQAIEPTVQRPTISSSTPMPSLQRQLSAVPEYRPRTSVMPRPFTVELPVLARTVPEPPSRDQPLDRPTDAGPTIGGPTIGGPTGGGRLPTSVPTSDPPISPTLSPQPGLAVEVPLVGRSTAEPAETTSGPEPASANLESTAGTAEPETPGWEQTEPTAPLSGFAARIAGLTNPTEDAGPPRESDRTVPPPVQRLAGPAAPLGRPARIQPPEGQTRMPRAASPRSPEPLVAPTEPLVVPTVGRETPLVQRTAHYTADPSAVPSAVTVPAPSDLPTAPTEVTGPMRADGEGLDLPAATDAPLTPAMPPSAPDTALPVVARLGTSNPPPDTSLPPNPGTETAALVSHRSPLAVRFDLSSAVAPPSAVQQVSFASRGEPPTAPRPAAPAAVQRTPARVGAPVPSRAAESPVSKDPVRQAVDDEPPVVPMSVTTGHAEPHMEPIPVQRRPPLPAISSESPLVAPATGPARSFAAMFANAPAGQDEVQPGYTTVQLQTAAEPPTTSPPPEEPGAAPAAAPPVETAAPPPTVATAANPTAVPATAGSAAADLDEMARRLFEPLSARLRAELWLDRERAGLVTDARH